ncbi:MAG: glycosyltransferase family 92 protein [candidate division WOR-3 bacterium]
MAYFLSVLAIFKNESCICQEWVEHYLSEGVEHFYLIDNGSTDNYQKILKPYIQDKIVDLKIDPRPHMQIDHYNSYLDQIKKESQWIMVVDFDEFIYSRLNFKTIADYLKILPDTISQVYVQWKIFGSNLHINHPESVIDAFTMRTKYDHVKTNCMYNKDKILTKTIVRTKNLIKFNIHCSLVDKNTSEITSDGKPITYTPPNNNAVFQNIDEEILQQSALHCNHYPIQSFNWFKKIKMTRGSASSIRNDKVRTLDYFNSFNSHANQIPDLELRTKRYNFKVYYGNDFYLDVTRHVIKHFYAVDNKQLNISPEIQFNQYFGDPTPGVPKYLIIRQNGQLKVYPEHDHGKIVLDNLTL